jgi:tetratricopeptide (TPR) repeat protein
VSTPKPGSAAFLRLLSPLIAMASVAAGQTQPAQATPTGPVTTGSGAYVPGVTYEAANPNYMTRNPFYFEGRIDWNLLKITTPSNTWEFVQRGIHYQDDLQDFPNAIADYQTAISMNSLSNATCQIFTTAPPVSPTVTPAPCMLTPRLRLANLLMQSDPDTAIGLFQQVLAIDALRLGVNAFIGEAYEVKASTATDETAKQAFLASAVAAYKAELALSPVTPTTIALTSDKANNAHVHWSLAEIYAESGDQGHQATELQAYLDATQWHSDTYPWRIQLAKARLAKMVQGNVRRR